MSSRIGSARLGGVLTSACDVLGQPSRKARPAAKRSFLVRRCAGLPGFSARANCSSLNIGIVIFSRFRFDGTTKFTKAARPVRSESQRVELIRCRLRSVFGFAELALSDHEHDLYAGEQSSGVAKGLEAEHRSGVAGLRRFPVRAEIGMAGSVVRDGRRRAVRSSRAHDRSSSTVFREASPPIASASSA
jgi:hypothetical protein